MNPNNHITRTDRRLPPPTLSRLRNAGRTLSRDQEDLRGRVVRNPTGQKVGRIEHLLVDDAVGRVRFLEIASGGWLHLDEARSFVPVEAIERITKDDVFIRPTLERVVEPASKNPGPVDGDARSFLDPYPPFAYEDAVWVAPWISSWPSTRRWNRLR